MLLSWSVLSVGAKVVISQPMLFPWLGLVEQFRLADKFVFYDDAAFSKGGFTNRVQVKAGDNISWLSIPIKRASLGTPINQTPVMEGNWKRKHMTTLSQSYSRSPYRDDVVDIMNSVYRETYDTICDYAIKSMLAIVDYIGIGNNTEILYSSELGADGRSSQKVLSIVRSLGGCHYITGHGARRYLEHHSFDEHNIEVSYMDYNIGPYPQSGQSFTPFVSSLDAIAALGKDVMSAANSTTINWRDFIDGRARKI